ncbi:cytochrome b/b6 domain-containing protein [Novosphingobium sp.]|uniref:cytochrome b/b6 domain-containing protein n=1 Tax=Novosphingobium sp. TaxID=1874826 RepID=UPI0027368EBB|nr:cytochrome b/b6 domain-containing protein [Novosphingobium sp.]MDP3905682.1 cytochrome b/b6 domain-containing protein [Novosphingobium sp.]
MKALRFYHVLLAGLTLLAYFTAEELGLVHAWTGYAVAAVLALRLVLGLVRKRGFELRRLVPSLAAPPRGQSGIRHPIISRLLVLAILTSVAGAAGTGIAMDQGGTLVGNSIRLDDERGEGREQGNEDHDQAAGWPSLIPPAYADEGGEGGSGEGEHDEGPLGELHELFGNLILPLVALHALYLLLFRFELARFMLFSERRRA